MRIIAKHTPQIKSDMRQINIDTQAEHQHYVSNKGLQKWKENFTHSLSMTSSPTVLKNRVADKLYANGLLQKWKENFIHSFINDFQCNSPQ